MSSSQARASADESIFVSNEERAVRAFLEDQILDDWERVGKLFLLDEEQAAVTAATAVTAVTAATAVTAVTAATAVVRPLRALRTLQPLQPLQQSCKLQVTSCR